MGYTPEVKRIKRSSQEEERLPLNRERFPRNRERLDQDSTEENGGKERFPSNRERFPSNRERVLLNRERSHQNSTEENGRKKRLISKSEKLKRVPLNRERLDQESTEDNGRISITGGRGSTTKFWDLPTALKPTSGVQTLDPASQVDREILDLEKLEKLASKLVESAAFQDGKASRTAESVFQPAFLESESASQGADSLAFQEWKASRTAESAFQVENYSKGAESVAFKDFKSALEAMESANQEFVLAASNGRSELASLAAQSAAQKWISASQVALKLARSTLKGRPESAVFQRSEWDEWYLASQVEESAFPGSELAFQGSESAFQGSELAFQEGLESASKGTESAALQVEELAPLRSESAFQGGLESASFQEWYSASQVEESASKFSESAYDWIESLPKWIGNLISDNWIEKMKVR